jgi:hypothetical protein
MAQVERGALRVAQAVLAGVLAAMGAIELATPLPELARLFAWTIGVPVVVVRLAAVVEILAAVVTVVPPWRRAALPSRLIPTGIALGAAIAAASHLARGEPMAFRITLLVSVLAASVAWAASRDAARMVRAQRAAAPSW